MDVIKNNNNKTPMKPVKSSLKNDHPIFFHDNKSMFQVTYSQCIKTKFLFLKQINNDENKTFD